MKLTTKEMSLTAVFMAFTFIVTRFIQIPIPLGYFNVGNTVILCACAFLPAPCGAWAGGIGSALADLTSFPVYTIPTLIIKTVMPLLFYKICTGNASLQKQVFAAGIVTLVPLFGYTLVGMYLAGSVIAGIAQFPGLLLEYAANLILTALLLRPVRRLRNQLLAGSDR